MGVGDFGASPVLPTLAAKRIRIRPGSDSLTPKFDAALPKLLRLLLPLGKPWDRRRKDEIHILTVCVNIKMTVSENNFPQPSL